MELPPPGTVLHRSIRIREAFTAGQSKRPAREDHDLQAARRPCHVEHHGKDHNEVINTQDRHLKAQVAAGDEAHREAHEAMRGRWKHPVSGLGWYRDVKRAFAGLSEA